MRAIKMFALVALMLTCVALVKYMDMNIWMYVLFLVVGSIASGEK